MSWYIDIDDGKLEGEISWDLELGWERYIGEGRFVGMHPLWRLRQDRRRLQEVRYQRRGGGASRK
jgi:hypothetical protein